jgi:hypothetical protein
MPGRRQLDEACCIVCGQNAVRKALCASCYAKQQAGTLLQGRRWGRLEREPHKQRRGKQTGALCNPEIEPLAPDHQAGHCQPAAPSAFGWWSSMSPEEREAFIARAREEARTAPQRANTRYRRYRKE